MRNKSTNFHSLIIFWQQLTYIHTYIHICCYFSICLNHVVVEFLFNDWHLGLSFIMLFCLLYNIFLAFLFFFNLFIHLLQQPLLLRIVLMFCFSAVFFIYFVSQCLYMCWLEYLYVLQWDSLAKFHQCSV